jgi:hypothetical protein
MWNKFNFNYIYKVSGFPRGSKVKPLAHYTVKNTNLIIIKRYSESLNLSKTQASFSLKL